MDKELAVHHQYERWFAAKLYAFMTTHRIDQSSALYASDLFPASMHCRKFYETWADCMWTPEQQVRNRELAYYQQFEVRWRANG